MSWENLSVRRIIIHEVYPRRDDRSIVPPAYGQQLIALSPGGMAEFSNRVMSVIGSRSQSMEMTIKAPTGASLIEVCRDIAECDNDEFIVMSRRFADMLTNAQLARKLPGGIVVVFDGAVGNDDSRLVGVIKAETHSGFRRTPNFEVQFVNDLFLTPQTKLYKLGIFVRSDDDTTAEFPINWSATVYDNQMSASNRDGAAQYFYESFLGCVLPATGSRMTRKFYEHTKNFIGKMNATPEKKADYIAGLYSYLKVDQSETIDCSTFSNQFFPPETRDSYSGFMLSQEFPMNAIRKDISEISSQLKRRRISFDRNIQLTGPSDAFEKLVTVRDVMIEVAAVGDAAPTEEPATEIIIRGSARDVE